MYLKLAWRNLWRNKRRTSITMASVFFAVILSTLMMSIKEGTYVNMIQSMVGSYMGYAQIHADGYWDDQNLDNSMVLNDTLIKIISSDSEIDGYVQRVETFSLAASKDVTKGAMVVGIDPVAEGKLMELDERVVEGDYLEAEDKAVLLGAGLADFLELGVGDTIVLLGQGFHGVSAAGKYLVKGLIKFGSPELSKHVIFLPLKEAQWLFGMENRCTSVILLLRDPNAATDVTQQLAAHIDSRFEVMSWETLMPELINMIETDRVEGYVFMFILYLVVSFGIFGTVLMMLAERRHEFGVLVAIGMKRVQLALVVWIEVIIISICGAFAGMIGALPVCTYFYLRPVRFGEDISKMVEDYGMEAVLQASIQPEIFVQQALIVTGIACFISIYPLIKVMHMSAIEAMRQ